ncbi:hypothetical protein T4C_13615 [Trichinella pseudospiralis]|uniref:Uncharacterized protein n=1 Tax=Trichinella pseudospiralis TaxID=6337 RepID=A0A0V1GND7_TRIPS|nr:hypothetical protein T4C_13615 [Trichinella pseudospiralis]
MNRNTHGEDRRKLEQVTTIGGWIESCWLVHHGWSVAFIGQIEVSVDTLEKTTRFAEVERLVNRGMNRVCHY